MILLHRIGDRKYGSNFNTLEEILKLPMETPLSFDGIYEEVWEHREQLRGRDITLFFCGAHLARDNSFDVGQPHGNFIGYERLFILNDMFGFKLGYHSLTHQNLCLIESDVELLTEIKPPFKMDAFAYPYGNVNARVASFVEHMGYKEAYSVTQGDGSQFQKRRRYLNW